MQHGGLFTKTTMQRHCRPENLAHSLAIKSLPRPIVSPPAWEATDHRPIPYIPEHPLTSPPTRCSVHARLVMAPQLPLSLSRRPQHPVRPSDSIPAAFRNVSALPRTAKPALAPTERYRDKLWRSLSPSRPLRHVSPLSRALAPASSLSNQLRPHERGMEQPQPRPT